MLPHLFQATQTDAASSHGELFMLTGSQKSLAFLTSLERVLTFVTVGHLLFSLTSQSLVLEFC